MKFLVLFALISIALCVPKENVIGESYTENQGKQDVVAVTYSQASNGGHHLDDLDGWMSPTVVQALEADTLPPSPGPIESADEIPSETHYYDGSTNLNVKNTVCKSFISAQSCVKQVKCGWCNTSTACVSGTKEKATSPCESGYSYDSAPAVHLRSLSSN
jgi:hypothetical protein